MAKMKGFYKGFKFISQIFVIKEQEMEMEMEIGCPTDVKHVAHIGWDGPSGNGPTWMKEFSNAPEFQSSLREAADTPGPNPTGDGSLHSQGTGNSMGGKSTSCKSKDDPTSEATTVLKKQKRKKIKSSSSSSKSSSRSSRGGKSKEKQPEMQSIAVAAAS